MLQTLTFDKEHSVMKHKVLAVVVAASLIAAGVAVAEVVIGGDDVYGPWTCTSCTVATPRPDPQLRRT